MLPMVLEPATVTVVHAPPGSEIRPEEADESGGHVTGSGAAAPPAHQYMGGHIVPIEDVANPP